MLITFTLPFSGSLEPISWDLVDPPFLPRVGDEIDIPHYLSSTVTNVQITWDQAVAHVRLAEHAEVGELYWRAIQKKLGLPEPPHEVKQPLQ